MVISGIRQKAQEIRWRWRARRFRQRPGLPAILLYHSVSDRERDPLLLAVRPERFAAQMAWLARHTTPLPLGEFAERLAAGRLPEDAVAVTFDDGYADNFEVAGPILAQHAIPATVFVATEGIGRTDEPWWEDLDAILLESPRLPERFVSEHLTFAVESERDPHRAAWNVLGAPVTLRERAFLAAGAWARRQAPDKRTALLDQLRQWAQGEPIARPNRRMASWNQIREAVARGLIEIGGHTHAHSCLAALGRADQRAEIATGTARLAEELGRRPAGFAYPFGNYADFSADTRHLVRQAGYRYAVVSMNAHVGRRFDPWTLPRVWVGDWEVDALAARLGLCAS